MAVTVYRSDDVGAPTLTVADGNMITLLDAVLVNGYGAKPAAGWTKEFSGTNQAIYRNSAANGGMGCFFQIDDSKALNGSSTNQTQFAVSGATNMTGFDAHTETFGLADVNLMTKGYSTNVTQVQSWIIVADEHTVIIFSRLDSNVNAVTISPSDTYIPYTFGDYCGGIASQQSTSCIAGMPSYTTASTSLTGSYYIDVHKNEDGSYPSSGRRSKAFLGATATHTSLIVNAYPDKYKGKHVIQALGFLGQQTYQLSGLFRGIHCVRTKDTTGLQTGDTFTENGKDFLLIRALNSTFDGFIAVEVSDTWEPV